MIHAEELSEQFKNQHEEYKKRWHDLIAVSTGDSALAARILRQMVTSEMDAKAAMQGVQ